MTPTVDAQKYLDSIRQAVATEADPKAAAERLLKRHWEIGEGSEREFDVNKEILEQIEDRSFHRAWVTFEKFRDAIINKLFPFALIKTKQGKEIAVNECGVIDYREAGEVLRYTSKKAEAAIYLLELEDGWIVIKEYSHGQGDYCLSGEPFTVKDKRHKSREDAIKAATEQIIKGQESTIKSDNSCTNDGQRKEAKKIIEWTRSLLEPKKELNKLKKKGAVKMKKGQKKKKEEERKIVRRELACTLGNDELVKYSKEMARQLSVKIEAEGRLKRVKSEITADINKAEAEVNVLRHKIESGEEHREVDCYYVYNWEGKEKSLFRDDTGELVKIEEIEEHERQEKLKLEDKGTQPCPDCRGKKTVNEGTEACPGCKGHGVIPLTDDKETPGGTEQQDAPLPEDGEGPEFCTDCGAPDDAPHSDDCPVLSESAMEVKPMDDCPECGGTGGKEGEEDTPFVCEACSGTGVVEVVPVDVVNCEECEGSGTTEDKSELCPECNGTGVKAMEAAIEPVNEIETVEEEAGQ